MLSGMEQYFKVAGMACAVLVPFAIVSSVAMYEMDRNTRTDIERTIGGKVDACLARIPHGWLRNSNQIQHLDHVEYPVGRGANLCLALEIPAPSDHGSSPVGGREAPQPGQQTGHPAWFRTPA
jgi:hypothetical protein